MGKGLLGLLGFGRGGKLLDLFAFRERVASKVRALHPDAVIEREGDETLLVRLSGDVEAATLNCARLHQFYCQSPADLDVHVGQLAAAVDGRSTTAAADALRVLVRPETYLFNGDDAQLSRPLVGDLCAIVAIDSDAAVGF
ncbi:MAG: hypothetical protein JNL41_02480, partial [Phenylobacterium sp.]|uniref:hypothetical protein n=1 Tax=Phenylobacterium sp. TaxID=1871053 RepID=UPI001A636303